VPGQRGFAQAASLLYRSPATRLESGFAFAPAQKKQAPKGLCKTHCCAGGDSQKTLHVE